MEENKFGGIMNNWQEIKTPADIDELLAAYGYFHDSCLASAVFQGGTHVDHQLHMHFDGVEKYRVTVTYQRQYRPKTLELRFIGLHKLSLCGERDLSLLDEPHLAFHENLLALGSQKVILWANYEFFDQEIKSVLNDPECSYIIANRMEWRMLDD